MVFVGKVILFASVAIVNAELHCGLDPMINVDTWSSYLNEVGFIFGSACGRNRGIFVTNPPDGHTYNCAHFPTAWNVTDANGIKLLSNATAAVEILDTFIASVYYSTPTYARKTDPGSCDFEALSALTCGREYPWKTAPWATRLNNQPIRSVNLHGLFVLNSAVLGGFTDWSVLKASGIVHEHLAFTLQCESSGECDKLDTLWNSFYSAADFASIKTTGLNTVRIPIGFWYFDEMTGVSSVFRKPAVSIFDAKHPLTATVALAKEAGLQVILVLDGITEEEGAHAFASPVSVNSATTNTATALAHYFTLLQSFGIDNVLLLEIALAASLSPSDTAEITKTTVTALHAIHPTLPVMFPSQAIVPQHDNLYLDMPVLLTEDAPDIASDTPYMDREKMFAHEKIACGYKAPLHFTTCTKAPVLAGAFSLAIDDCLDMKSDFGQCTNLEERLTSPWWHRHTLSLAMRQIQTFERELGWSFSYWKLDEVTEASNPAALYWSFSMAIRAGIIDMYSIAQGTNAACNHAPAADFFMGDATYYPTAEATFTAESVASPIAVVPSHAVSQQWVVGAACGLVLAGLAGWLIRSRQEVKRGYAPIPYAV